MLLATTASITAFSVGARRYSQVESEILRGATTPVVTVYVETAQGARLGTWSLARNTSAIIAALNTPLLLYLFWRFLRLRFLRARPAPP